MWIFTNFMPKEQSCLDGRTLDIENLKIQVRNTIAEGGFSSVYLARDFYSGKQYAMKHIICNDEESLDLVKKEIEVMKLLKGHPNVITLHAQTILDFGRTKEAFLVMEYCEKSLVSVLENRDDNFFEEKQILLIFRDVCNAVFAMHSHSPPIAHRDLKAENVLLGSDGAWKLCDFGSISTKYKRHERPEEMGIEEDNIRKHTTPAYRAPEMWDLFRRELINEKVDIWALGCLLYRICYLKSAFDGESKLQILNVNYLIPDIPRHSSSVTDMIRGMLQATPNARPDVMQVWHCVNEQLPIELQKQAPNKPMSLTETHPNVDRTDDEFDCNKLNLESDTLRKELWAQAEKLKEELKQVATEKAEITAKCEKLMAICRSQRQEIQVLKQAVASGSYSQNKNCSNDTAGSQVQAQQNQKPSGGWHSNSQQRDKVEGLIWELQEGMLANNSATASTESTAWQAFSNNQDSSCAPNFDPKVAVHHANKGTNIRTAKQAESWGFGEDQFTATFGQSQLLKPSNQANSQRFGSSGPARESSGASPAGWAGF